MTEPSQSNLPAPQPAATTPEHAQQPPQIVYYGPPPTQDVVTTDSRVRTVEVVIAWLLTVLTFGYLLPWAIAASRGKSNSIAIGVINLFLGWLVIGWIVALVMACGAHQAVVVRR